MEKGFLRDAIDRIVELADEVSEGRVIVTI